LLPNRSTTRRQVLDYAFGTSADDSDRDPRPDYYA
jgi:hypothetical protein